MKSLKQMVTEHEKFVHFTDSGRLPGGDLEQESQRLLAFRGSHPGTQACLLYEIQKIGSKDKHNATECARSRGYKVCAKVCARAGQKHIVTKEFDFLDVPVLLHSILKYSAIELSLHEAHVPCSQRIVDAEH